MAHELLPYLRVDYRSVAPRSKRCGDVEGAERSARRARARCSWASPANGAIE